MVKAMPHLFDVHWVKSKKGYWYKKCLRCEEVIYPTIETELKLNETFRGKQ